LANTITDSLYQKIQLYLVMWAHQLKMNRITSFLRVSSSKFVGFIVTSKRIHLDPDKINSIQSMSPPKTLKELRGQQGSMPIYEGSL